MTDEENLRYVIACALADLVERDDAGDFVEWLFDCIVDKLRQHPRLFDISRFELEMFLFDLKRKAEVELNSFAEIRPDFDAREIIEAITEENEDAS